MSVIVQPRIRYHVVYQVFVDRYDPGGPVPVLPARAEAEGTVRRRFGAMPDQPPRGLDLQGGTLDGITGRLPHIAAFADALYLTPITRAPSNHKYDTADFDEIDDHFGGAPALARLTEATRAAGVGLFVDAVLNHVGERHPWVTDPKHEERLRGSAWRGYGHLRELALDRPAVRDALVGEGGVVARMIARGIDGLRLDCANDLGPAFCGLVAAAIRRAGGRGGAIGEVMAWPLPFLDAGALDGVMSYWPRAALLAALADPGHAAACAHALDRLAAAAPKEALLRSWTIASSHDTPRISDAVGFDERKARLLFAVLFAYPGTPMLYYGEELGMTGGADPGCRGAMIWDEARWDRERLAFVRRLTALRRALPALHDGDYLPLPTAPPVIAFARSTGTPADALVCVANLAPVATEACLLLPLPGLYDALPLEDLLSGDRVPIEAGAARVPLPPFGVRWLAPKDDHPSGYRFWKQPPLR